MVSGLVDISRKQVDMSFSEMCRLGLGIWKCSEFRNYREVRKKESGGMHENAKRMSLYPCVLCSKMCGKKRKSHQRVREHNKEKAR